MKGRRPLVIGLTGSIGMGKSTVAAMFRRFRLPVFDADAVVRAVQGPGGAAVAAIESRFPGSTGAEGVVRPQLARMVFGKPQALRDLQAIVHPLVEAHRRQFLRRHRWQKAVVLDVPLLLEGEAWRQVDMVVVVSAPYAVQRARVLARPGMTGERFQAILGHQMPDAEKRELADIVVDTGHGYMRTYAMVRAIVKACLARD